MSTAAYFRPARLPATLAPVVLFGVAAAAFVGQGVASADAPNPTVEAVPAVVELLGIDARQVIVIVRNPSAETLGNARLSALADIPVDVDVRPSYGEPQPLPPNAAAVWTLQLKRGRGLTAGSVHLRVDYTWMAAGAAGAIETPGVAIGSVDVRPPSLAAIEIPATVELKTVLDKVSERRPGKLYVVVTNRSSLPIEVTEIKPMSQKFVTFDPPSYRSSYRRGGEINPGGVQAFPFDVKVTDPVPPGKQLLVFEVTLFSADGSQRVIATHEADVSVFGESEFAGLNGAPAFLLLPGLIMTWLWGGLSALIGPPDFGGAPRPEARSDNGASGLVAKVTDIAKDGTLAVGLSVLMAFVGYPLVLALLAKAGSGTPPRNYLDGYGTNDLFVVWLIAVAATAVIFLAAKFVGWRVRMYMVRNLPRWNDPPLVLMRRLSGIGLPNSLPLIKGDQGLLLYGRHEAGSAERWIGPQIVVGMPQRWNGGQRPTELLRALNRELTSAGDLRRLADLLSRLHPHHVDTRYKGGPRGPHLAPTAEVEENEEQPLVIRIE